MTNTNIWNNCNYATSFFVHINDVNVIKYLQVPQTTYKNVRIEYIFDKIQITKAKIFATIKQNYKTKCPAYAVSHMQVTSRWLHSTSTHFSPSPTHSIIIQLNVPLFVGRPSAQFVQGPIADPVSNHLQEPSMAKSVPPIQQRYSRLP